MKRMSIRPYRLWLLGAVLVAPCLPFTADVALAAPAAYPTAQAAADAFRAATQKEDDGQALLEVLGPEYKDALIGGDPAAWRQGLVRLRRAAGEAMTVTPEGEDRAELVLGTAGWPMPVPLVKDAQGWHFDTPAGIEEITDRRIGRNELSAIEVCQQYPDAQAAYAAQHRNGDEVREYAQRLISTTGKKDGLYWPDQTGDDPSPFGPLIAEAADYAAYRQAGEPYRGYYFKILTGQGANPPGGKYGYVINGYMIAGYALVAWPADYGKSGIMTFVVNQQGQVYEKDLGPDTAKIAADMKEYDPDQSWAPSEG